MIEAIGHEFMEDFFGSFESVLEENGLVVLHLQLIFFKELFSNN